MTKRIAIFGAGGLGREVAMLIEQINAFKNTWEIIGFYDDGVSVNTESYGYKVLGGVEELNKEKNELYVVFAIGDPKIKKKVVTNISNTTILYPILVHPNALIGSKDVKIGEGSIVAAGNILTVNINVGKHVILNLACTVGHDTNIGDYSSFMPAVNISGEVEIGEGVYVGTGAKIINQLEIGVNTIVGAGAVVSKTLPANCTAVGIPAKPIKFHE
jgi:sugar O-acyltransferase (sialic acid O-acetyltransferase NeuD family)